MDWILLDNKPLNKLTKQHDDINNKLDLLTKKIDELNKKNIDLENFLIHNQKLYLKQFNIICDILQENRALYMKQFQNESDEIESLKPILNDIKHRPQATSPVTVDSSDNDSNLMVRFNNLVWRSTSKRSNRGLNTTPRISPINLISQSDDLN
jgi:hypothetical protein